LAQSNLPNVTFPVDIPAGQGSHTHSYNQFAAGNTTAAGGNPPGGSIVSASTSAATLPEMSGTATTGGASASFLTVAPTITVNYIIKMKSNSTGAGGVVSLGGMFGDIVCDATFNCSPQGSPVVNTIGVNKATASNYFSATPNTVITSDIIYQPEVPITSTSTTNFDFSTFNNAVVTMSTNIAMATVSNVIAGKSGYIRFIQPASGGPFTIPTTLNSIFKCAGSACNFVLSTAANAVDVLFYNCATTTFCMANFNKAFQ